MNTQNGTVATASPERPAGRSFLLDLLKAVGCVLIVLHHLAFYGPMSDVVAQRWPAVIDWLVDDGRLAVQVFLVCSGYLTAVGFARNPEMDARRGVQLAWRRYVRLSLPLLAALSVAVLVTEAIRSDFNHPSLSATPDVWQVLAHVLLLQHLIDLEALSAGIWYVAIDFQLYLLTLSALWGVSRWMRWHPDWRSDALRVQVFLLLTLLSLLRWNLNTDMDMYGLYFFGAYGLGWLAWRTRQSRIPPKGWVGLLSLGLLALWVDPRLRIMTAWATAMLLAAAPQSWLQARQFTDAPRRAIGWLARVSYSVFVIHFAVSLAVSAWVTHVWPQSLFWNTAGMVMSLCLSVLAGAILHRWTEQKNQNWRHWLFWVAVFMASAGLAMHWASTAA
jgi:peptidoglycan/LPS O-acetylase OafA/YrhL